MLKVIGLAIALLLCMAPSSPATIYYHIYEPLQNSTGEALTGTTYLVYDAGTTDTSAIYSDAAGTRNYQGSGETTGSDGMIDFYVPAGSYDVYYSHSGWNISGTFENYRPGIADSLGSACADSLKPCSGDTVRVRASDGQNDAVLQSKGMYARDFWAPADSRSLWFRKLTQATGRYIYAIGGDLDSPAVQMSNTTKLSWEFEDGNDRSVVYVDTLGTGEASDGTVNIRNVRGNLGYWTVDSSGDTGTGFMSNVPDVAIRFDGNIPDDADTVKTLVRVRHTGGNADVTFVNNESCYFDIYDEGTFKYRFQKQGLQLAEGTFIHFGGGTGYTKIGHTDDTSTYINANSQLLNIRDDDGSDDANLDVKTATIDTLKGDTQYIRAADGQDDAKLDSYQIQTDILTVIPWAAALPGTTAIQALGTGAALFRHFDAEPAVAATLFVWDDADTIYHYFIQDGTQAAP